MLLTTAPFLSFSASMCRGQRLERDQLLSRSCPTPRPARQAAVPRASFGSLPFQPEDSGFAGQTDSQTKFKSIFQAAYLPPLENSPTVEDARDALETCSTLDGEAKAACFALFNCEPKQVEQYYGIVSQLENALWIDTEPEEEAAHGGSER